MDENNKNKEEPSFADMLDSYLPRMSEDLNIGDKLECSIISISDDIVIVDTGTKLDGIVEKKEFLDDQNSFPYSVGDKLELYVISRKGSELHLSKALSMIESVSMLEDAYERGIPIEGKIIGTCKGGFNVSIMKRRAFCPISQIDTRYTDDPDIFVGQTHQFLMTTFEAQGKNIVVSRRKLLEREYEKARQDLVTKLEPGVHLSGTVSRLMPFGAFVELAPGTEGLIPLSELSWSHISKPEEIVQSGQEVTIQVLSVEKVKKAPHLKISLSLKRMEPTPWENVEKTIKPGDIMPGKVTRCRDFGAFVEIQPGIEGLVHISEISSDKRIIRPEDVLKAGQEINVLVKDIDLQKRRISLSLKDAEGDVWSTIKDRFFPKQKINGVVEKKEKFGIFVSLGPGINGFLPKDAVPKKFWQDVREGQTIPVIIMTINQQERKITLGLGGSPDDINIGDYYQEDQPQSELGAKLLQALKNKNNNIQNGVK